MDIDRYMWLSWRQMAIIHARVLFWRLGNERERQGDRDKRYKYEDRRAFVSMMNMDRLRGEEEAERGCGSGSVSEGVCACRYWVDSVAARNIIIGSVFAITSNIQR